MADMWNKYEPTAARNQLGKLAAMELCEGKLLERLPDLLDPRQSCCSNIGGHSIPLGTAAPEFSTVAKRGATCRAQSARPDQTSSSPGADYVPRMELKPRYDVPDYLRFEGTLSDPSVTMLRQRRRLASTLADLDDAQWAAASRCDEWSVQDVIAHLVTTNQFWAISIMAGRNGEPTRILDGFDPVASPAQMVDDVRSVPATKVLERFVESTDGIAHAVAGLDDDGWSTIGEAPPGHIPLRGVALHALWDSWIHERDIVLPLGLTPVEEADEIADCLRYAGALSPAFAVAYGSTRRGSILIETTDPEVRVVVDVGESIVVHDGDPATDPLHLTGPAVALLEWLSYRAPLTQSVPDEHRWMFDGLARAFDREL
jgi:uncharacterized protein (TIGR03083 family)